MADGFVRPPPIVHSDGVYLDLSMDDYHRDRAISSTGLKKLIPLAPDWWWEHPDNELWEQPESEARALGHLVHAAVLEGIPAYESRYCVKPAPPEGALVTCEHMQDWLRNFIGALPVDLDPSHYSNFGKKNQSLRLSGGRDELVSRIRLLDDTAPIWDDGEGELAGRAPISAKSDRYTRLVEKFIRSDPAYAPFLTDGVAEVSIFWTSNGIRYKARLDYLNAAGILDLKKFGQPPKMGRSLIQHVLNEAAIYGYDIQAVHNVRAVEAAAELIAGEALEFNATGHDANARINRCADVLRSLRELHHKGERVTFRWLFVRTPGAPVSIAVRFEAEERYTGVCTDEETDAYRNPNLIWEAAERKIEAAMEQFREYRAHCGDEMWMRSDGEVTPHVSDWPTWTTEIANV